MTVGGVVRPPGDKSISHRVLILSALSRGGARISGVLTAHDAKSTARVLRQLGVEVSPLRRGAVVRVRGRAWQQPAGTLQCGNSGTTARLLLGALAGHRFRVRLDGDASLRRRPMKRVTEPLMRMGARIEGEVDDGLPLTIRGGKLNGLRYESPVASAQVKTALMLAGLTGRVPVTVVEPYRSRDHTERLFRFLGFAIGTHATEVTFTGPDERWPYREQLEFAVPGDASSAAFLVAAALLARGGELLIEAVGVNPTRTGFLAVLDRMGAGVRIENQRELAGEPVADLVVRPARLLGTEVGAEEIPTLIDEVPILAALAARAEGETVFRAVGELRVKESDRLGLIAANLRGLGAHAEVAGEDLVVSGSDTPLAGRVETAGDHRLTMAFAVLGTAPGCDVELSERASAAVSYPGFFDDLRTVLTRA